MVMELPNLHHNHCCLASTSIRKGALCVAILVSIIIIAGAISASVLCTKIQKYHAETIRAVSTRGDCRALLLSVVNAETGQRGYLLTGDLSYLEPYNEALTKVYTEYDTLMNNIYIQNYIPELTLLSPTHGLIADKLKDLNQTIMLRKTCGVSCAADAVNQNTGKRLLGDVRNILDKIITNEDEHFLQLQYITTKWLSNMIVFSYIAIAFLIISECAWLYLWFNSNWEARVERHYNKELNAALKEAQEATKVKSQFVANMSHEIRTPMNGVIAMCDLLDTTAMSNEQSEILSTVRASADDMMHLINDILSFCKLDSGTFQLNLSWFNLSDFLTPIQTMFTVRACAKKVEFHTVVESDVPTQIYADMLRLKQVIINLLDNAVKFTHHGSIGLHVELVHNLDSIHDTNITQVKGGIYESKQVDVLGPKSPISHQHKFHEKMIIFRVFDTGIGISLSAQQLIFEPFSQADMSSTRSYGGTGLGLSIGKQLAELMGGYLTVESQLERGSVFSLAIPCHGSKQLEPHIQLDSHAELCTKANIASALATNEATKVSTRHTFGTGSRPRALVAPAISLQLRVLLVEDNLVNQKVMVKLLERCACNVHLASNGLDALQSYTREPYSYDVILMDLHMPVMDGFTAARLIREFEHTGFVKLPIDAPTSSSLTLTSKSITISSSTSTSNSTSSRFHPVPIFAVTASPLNNDDCMSVGIDDIIIKPISINVLQAKLAALKHRSSDCC